MLSIVMDPSTSSVEWNLKASVINLVRKDSSCPLHNSYNINESDVKFK
jgi:hypothetical protein